MNKKYDIEKMREMKSSGMSQIQIARALGVSKGLVSYHLSKDVPANGISRCIYCKSPKTRIHLRKYYGSLVYFVSCMDCHARGPDRSSEEKAIRDWNTYNKEGA